MFLALDNWRSRAGLIANGVKANHRDGLGMVPFVPPNKDDDTSSGNAVGSALLDSLTFKMLVLLLMKQFAASLRPKLFARLHKF